MVISLALIGWDRKMGAVVETIYPENFNLSFDEINKIYMAHTINNEDFSKEEIIEITLDDKILLSYCDMRNVHSLGYEMILLIIHIKEKLQLETLRKKLLEFSREIISKSKMDRNQYFLDNLKMFFKEMKEKKILIMGRAGTGKSSMKKVIFEGIDPKQLISNPLEPTRGITPIIYSWLDLKIGLFDTSGQEIEDLLMDGNEQIFAFTNSDIVVYLLDFPMWVVHKDIIISDIKRIRDIITKNSYNSRVVIIFHKIDLINLASRYDIINTIKKIIDKELNVPIFFTSLYPELIYNTYNAFYEILSSFSDITQILKEIIDEALGEHSKTLIFITNNNHSIIAQNMSSDFNTPLINHIHKLSAQLTQTFEDMCHNENIESLILSSTKNLQILMRYMELEDHDIKNVICASETIKITDLTVKTHQVKLNCMNELYNLKLDE